MTANKAQRASKLKWVKLGDMFVDEHVQAKFNPAWAEAIANKLNLEGLGFPVLNLRADGRYHIVDGQHRIAALRLADFEATDTVECEVYEGLTPAEEAELFLERDERRAKTPYDKFMIALEAGRQREIDTNTAVQAQGLKIARYQDEGHVQAVGTVLYVHDKMGDVILGRVLRIMRDAFGMIGFDSNIIKGLALVHERYGGDIDEQRMINQLQKIRTGSPGLIQAAHLLRERNGVPMAIAMAAAVTEQYNRGFKVKDRVPAWWKDAA